MTNFTTAGASTVTATLTDGLSDHSVTSANLVLTREVIISAADTDKDKLDLQGQFT